MTHPKQRKRIFNKIQHLSPLFGRLTKSQIIHLKTTNLKLKHYFRNPTLSNWLMLANGLIVDFNCLITQKEDVKFYK